MSVDFSTAPKLACLTFRLLSLHRSSSSGTAKKKKTTTKKKTKVDPIANYSCWTNMQVTSAQNNPVDKTLKSKMTQLCKIGDVLIKDIDHNFLAEFCTRIHVRGMHDKKKHEMCAALLAWKTNKELFGGDPTAATAAATGTSTVVTSSAGSGRINNFRLVNALNSEKLKPGLTLLRGAMTKEQLDLGQCGPDEEYWDMAAAEYNNTSQFNDEQFETESGNFNPQNFTLIDGKKMESSFNALCSQYAGPYALWHRSGNNSKTISAFTNSATLMYFHCFVYANKDILSTVTRNLPEEVFHEDADSDSNTEQPPSRSNSHSKKGSNSKKNPNKCSSNKKDNGIAALTNEQKKRTTVLEYRVHEETRLQLANEIKSTRDHHRAMLTLLGGGDKTEGAQKRVRGCTRNGAKNRSRKMKMSCYSRKTLLLPRIPTFPPSKRSVSWKSKKSPSKSATRP